MRAILLLLILLVLAAIAAVATGLININQVQPAQAPDVNASRAGISASGGQAPRFEVQTGKVAVGSQERTVKLPSLQVRPAPGDASQNGQAAAPQGGPAPAPQNGGVATTNATQP